MNNPDQDYLDLINDDPNCEELLREESQVSDGSGTRNPGFGFWKCRGEMDF